MKRINLKGIDIKSVQFIPPTRERRASEWVKNLTHIFLIEKNYCFKSIDQDETPGNSTYKILGTIQCSSGCDSDDAHEAFLKRAADHFTDENNNIDLPLQANGALLTTNVAYRSFHYIRPSEYPIHHIEIEWDLSSNRETSSRRISLMRLDSIG